MKIWKGRRRGACSDCRWGQITGRCSPQRGPGQRRLLAYKRTRMAQSLPRDASSVLAFRILPPCILPPARRALLTPTSYMTGAGPPRRVAEGLLLAFVALPCQRREPVQRWQAQHEHDAASGTTSSPGSGAAAVTASTEQGETELGLGPAESALLAQHGATPRVGTKESRSTQTARELPAQPSHQSCATLSSACDPLDFSPGSSLTSQAPRGSSLLTWKQ